MKGLILLFIGAVLLTGTAAGEPAIRIKSPRDHQVIPPGGLMILVVASGQVRLVPPGTAEDPQNPLPAGYLEVSIGDRAAPWLRQDLDRNVNYVFLPADAPAGRWPLRVRLLDKDKQSLAPEQKVEFVVEADGQGPFHSLTSNGAWSPVPVEEDPLAHDRPPGGGCSEWNWFEEGGTLEVQTGLDCDYLSLRQPLLQDIKAGDHLRVVAWHSQLGFDEPATAHVALLLGGDILWEEYVAIPSGAGSWDMILQAQRDVPAGTPIIFHLHNHGSNAWNLLTIDARRPPD